MCSTIFAETKWLVSDHLNFDSKLETPPNKSQPCTVPISYSLATRLLPLQFQNCSFATRLFVTFAIPKL